MAYKVVSRLEHNCEAFEIGDAISFADKDAAARDTLLSLGVIAEFDLPPVDNAPESELSKKTVAELTAIATAEGVSDLPDKAKKDAIIAGIEAKRIEVAKAAEGAGQE